MINSIYLKKTPAKMDNEDQRNSRMRRCKSVTRAEEIVKHDEQVRRAQPDKP